MPGARFARVPANSGHGRIRGGDRRRRRARSAGVQSRSRDLPQDQAHGRGHQARRRQVLPRRWRRDHARGRAAADDARALAERRAPGIVVSTREKGGGDAFYQKRIPKGAPDYVQTARIEFPSGRHADEICPTEVAVVGWAAQMGTITFHPWPVRSDDVDHPDELRIDLDPQPGTDFEDAMRVAAEARVPWTSSATRASRRPREAAASTYTSGSSPAGRLRTFATPRSRSGVSSNGDYRAKSRPSGGRRSAASASSSTTTRTPAIARLPRLQRPAEAARRSPRRSRGTNSPKSSRRTSRSRRCPRALPRWAIAMPRSTTPTTRCSPCWTCTRGTRRETCPTRPTIRRCRESRSAFSPRAIATASGEEGPTMVARPARAG